MKHMSSIALACSVLALSVSGAVQAKPVPLSDPGIKGYKFPEDKDRLMSWIDSGDAASIQLHGWGLWTSLTAPSGQSELGMNNVPVYLTWLTPAEIQASSAAAATKRLHKLERPRQHSHFSGTAKAANASASTPASTPTSASASATSCLAGTAVLVTMGYDPAAEKFAKSNNLFSLKALQSIYNAGSGDIRSIPSFPSNAVATKPTYKLITKSELANGKIFKMKAWPGTPQTITPTITACGFPETYWPGCVYVDTSNPGTSKATKIDAQCTEGPKPENTYGLGDFINYPVTKNNLASFSKLEATPLAVGDTLLLMAMHVTTREIDEWTWQTYFWTPDPANPPLPSSVAVAKARPAQLKGAAAHYAMSIGYQMVAPNQPINGGQSVGSPVTVYNPYLEADFNAGVFSTPPVNPGIQPKTGKPYMATVGIQTNCMTCHGNASVNPSNPNVNTNSLPYLTNFYFPRNDPSFKGYLQLDFLWSIQGTAK